MIAWLAATALLGGAALTLLDEGEPSLAARTAAAAVLGTVLLGMAGYPLASAFGMGDGVRAAAGALAATPGLLLALSAPRRRARAALSRALSAARSAATGRNRGLLASAVVGVVAAALLAGVMGSAVREENGGLVTGVAHNYGDLPFHIAIVQSFAIGDNYPPQHPELAGARLTYPFLTDFVAALLVGSGPEVASGAHLRGILYAQSALLACAFVFVFHGFARSITGEPLAAALAPAFALLGGGVGFWRLFPDHAAAGVSWLEMLRRLPFDYTIRSGSPLRFGNIVTTLLIPQRATLLGLPLFFLAAGLVWRGLQAPVGDAGGRRRLVLAGGVAALMPLAHAHSFAVLLASAAVWAVLFWRPRAWAGFFAVALGGGLPQAAWLAHGGQVSAGKFLAWQPGWEHGDVPLATFWLENAGLFLPLLVVALLWRGTGSPVPRRLVRFWVPFGLWFVVPNLWRLSPWMWDNIKVLVFWWLGSVPLVALLVSSLLRRRATLALGALATVLLTLSGGLDVWRAASGVVTLGIFDADGRAFAARIDETAPPHARIMIAPYHNHPVLLSGRRTWLGYEGHIWSQGLDAGDRRLIAGLVYAGRPEALSLLLANHVDFVAVGPLELREFPVGPQLTSHLQLAARVGRWALYRVPRLPGGGE